MFQGGRLYYAWKKIDVKTAITVTLFKNENTLSDLKYLFAYELSAIRL